MVLNIPKSILIKQDIQGSIKSSICIEVSWRNRLFSKIWKKAYVNSQVIFTSRWIEKLPSRKEAAPKLTPSSLAKFLVSVLTDHLHKEKAFWRKVLASGMFSEVNVYHWTPRTLYQLWSMVVIVSSLEANMLLM